jgi:carbon-monoxide dehydrogenase large subunit
MSEPGVAAPAEAGAAAAGAPAGYVGRPVRRVEDARLLVGLGRYVDDRAPAHALHLAIRRSDQPHARIVRIDASAARAIPGVHGVYAWPDVAGLVRPAVAISRMPGYQPTPIPALADGVVHYVGEPVVAVLASSRYVAEDAAECIEIDYEPLPFAGDPTVAAEPGAPRLHAGLASNVLVERAFVRGEVAAAFEQAAHVVAAELRFHRKAPLAMEPRCCVAEPDPGRDALTLYTSTQVPGVLRDALAGLLDLPGNRLTVIAPDVGGGFGGKTSLYAEEMLACALARGTRRPVRWTADRLEDLQSTSQAFDERVHAELAIDAHGRFLALRADVVSDVGAYSIYPWTAGIEPVQVISFMPGPYRIACYQGRVRAVATPKAPTGPYRGVGRPTSTFAMERLVDLAAAALSIDPAELRRRNLVGPGEFPYRVASGLVWDRSGFQESLALALEASGYAAARTRQAQARREGRWVGIGLATYAELSGIGSRISASPGMPINTGTDTCTLELDSTGSFRAAFGCASHGQGHETTLGQILADALGVPLESIRVVTGDSAAVPHGTGSYASRTAVISGGAAILAARELRARMLRVAAHLLDATPEVLRIDGGTITGPLEGRSLSVRELANALYSQMGRVPPDVREEMVVTRVYDPVMGTTTSATHVAEVELDLKTCRVVLVRYTIAEDCGRIINPMIVEGQTLGALAQGIGAALMEEVVYDESGQLLTASLVDYVVPTAPGMPPVEIRHVPGEVTTNIGGFRGMGEGGTIGSPAAIANAVSDALAPLGVAVSELPVTPDRLFRLVSQRHPHFFEE